MIINPLGAIDGAATLLGETATAAARAAATATLTPGSFADMVTNAASDAVQNLRGAEQTSMDALQGKADTREVVDAVMSAERSLQAAISIRDKIVTAYLEVGRMAI